MTILLIHLSDIHFQVPHSSSIEERAEAVVRAVKDLDGDVRAVAVLVTGDIAFSGLGTQYAIALDFLERLQAEIKRQTGLSATVVVAPGNHDCDFSGDNEARRLMIAGVLRDQATSVSASVIGIMTKVQDAFFDFMGALCPDARMLPGCERLIWDTELSIDGIRLLFRCFNSAWMSLKQETQGQLLFPIQLMPQQPSDHDLILGLFHHPLNWLESGNSRVFRRAIESTCDAMFTGHEHRADTYRRQAMNVSWNVDVHEAGVFAGSSDESEFRAVVLDVANTRQRVVRCQWGAGYYRVETPLPGWTPLSRNKARQRGEFIVSEAFAEELDGAGASFTHPRKGRLTIDDIYVDPNLHEVGDAQTRGTVINPSLNGATLIQRIPSTPAVVIFGAEASGKTTFARRAFKSLRQGGVVPVVVNGANLKKSDWDAIRSTLGRALMAQYGTEAPDKYDQLDRQRRALILDDFHLIELNPRGRSEVVRRLRDYFSSVLILSSDLELLSELSGGAGTHDPLDGFSRFELLDFGHALREQLIERWIVAGQEESISEPELGRRVVQTKRIVDVALGKNLIPHQPIFILIVLQQIEANTDARTASGAFGYLYGALITAALSRTGKQLDLDTAQNYLAEFAYEIYEKGRQFLTEGEMQAFHARYCESYNVRLRLDTVEAALGRADLLLVDGGYRFKYRYAYYYFVAREIASKLQTGTHGEILELLAKNVFREESANILVFLTYLSRDKRILDTMLASARSIYADSPKFSFSDHKFLEGLIEGGAKRVLLETEARESRKKLNEAQDEVDAISGQDEADAISGEKLSEPLEDSLRINEAFKTLQVLGQILKNFPGSLKAEVKREIARECYGLGLRSLRCLLQLVDTNAEGFVALLRDNLHSEGDAERRDRLARRFVAWLAEMLSVSTIRRISDAVGNPMLAPTYDEIVEEADDLPVAMVDLAVRLDHLNEFPEDAIENVARETKTVLLARNVVCRLVVAHFYKFERSREIRQRACDRLGMEFRRITLIEQSRITREGKAGE